MCCAREPIVHHKRRCTRDTKKMQLRISAAIRAKNRIWRAALRREAGGHENFFVAKNRDSESVQRTFDRHRSVATTAIAPRSLNALIAKAPAAQALPAISTFACSAFSCVPHVVARMHFDVAVQRALRVLAQARQHFLKRDTVFFDVLVYSG
jgi:hypothetical protein